VILRLTALVSFASLWLLAAALPGIRFSAAPGGGLAAVPLPRPLTHIGVGVSIAVAAAMMATAALFTVAVIRLIVRSRRRRDDETRERELEISAAPASWREYVLLLLLLASIVAVGRVAWLSSSPVSNASPSASPAPAEPAEQARPPTGSPVRAESPGPMMPPWAARLLEGTLAIIAVAVAASVVVAVHRAFRRRNAAAKPEDVPARLQMQGRRRDRPDGPKGAVEAAYWQMCVILETRRSMEGSMTSREFVRGLAQTGFPTSDVHALTEIFERVRYGHQPPEEEDAARARAALAAIEHQAGAETP
jgi:hypothetical protein